MDYATAFETGRLWKPLRDMADGLIYDPYTLVTLLPALRGFWPMSVINSNGDAMDMAHGSLYRLFPSGAPIYNLDNTVPYVEFDGTSDYLSIGDNAQFDISGTESYVDASIRGLTVGGWFRRVSSQTLARALVSKYAVAQYSYIIYGNPALNFRVSSDGTSGTFATITGATPAIGEWYFAAGRFVPSTEVSLFFNGSKVTNATAIPASIFNGTAALALGMHSAAAYMSNVRESFVFLCASALPDGLVDLLFQTTRGKFGV